MVSEGISDGLCGDWRWLLRWSEMVAGSWGNNEEDAFLLKGTRPLGVL